MAIHRNLLRLTAGEQSALALIVDWYDTHNRTFPSLTDQAKQAGYSRQNASLYRRTLATKGWLRLNKQGLIISCVVPHFKYMTIGGEEDAD